MILLSTIYHTGTHSAAEYFFGKDWKEKRKRGDMVWSHCSDESLELSKQAEKTITMYRSPEKVIQSWAKRDLWRNAGYRPERNRQWKTQWDVWAKLVPIAEVHSVSELPIQLSTFPDKSSFIPEGLLEYAIDKVNEVAHYLDFDLKTA